MTPEGVNGSGGGIGPVISLSGVIAADGLFVVADMLSDGTSSVPLPDLLANFDFQNGRITRSDPADCSQIRRT